MKKIEVSSTSHEVDMKVITQVSEFLEHFLNENFIFRNENFDQFILALHVFPSESTLFSNAQIKLFQYKKDRFMVFNVLFSSEEFNAWARTISGKEQIKARVIETIKDNKIKLSKVGFEEK